MSLTSERGEPLGSDLRSVLLNTARASIGCGVESGSALGVSTEEYEIELRQVRASFVTLRLEETLRGCMGTSHPVRALVEDVAHNAYSAAFLDPRFSPLTAEELPRLAIHISVLSPLERLSCPSEGDLLAVVRPGLDGLLLREGSRRGTLLPSVWETLAEPHVFLRELKAKAGFRADYWSENIEVFRYTTESFS